MLNKENQNQLFRLAAVLYADNNYEVAPKTILKKVVEAALLGLNNNPTDIHALIDFIQEQYSLNFDEQEIVSIINDEKFDGFLTKPVNNKRVVSLTEKRRLALIAKLSGRTIDDFILEFETLYETLVVGSNAREIIYRFLYELLSTNIESFKKLLDSKKQMEDLINIESHTYSPIEREIVNKFLSWNNDEKNKSIFDIASYALEYCMISNNGNGAHLHLNNLKNKVFYLDTNVIFRALGINGKSRQNRTIDFLKKFKASNTSLVISKFSEYEYKETIKNYIDKLKKIPVRNKLNPKIFDEEHFNSLADLYDFYFKWRANKINDSLDLFEGELLSMFEKLKTDFSISVDLKIPFDTEEEKTVTKLNEIASNIGAQKVSEGARHSLTSDYNDACNILLIETRRDGKNTNIFETKYFIVSTDQALRRWDYHRNIVTPIVILPSQWLSILLRYLNRTSDDFRSFVSFLNLPRGDSSVNSEKLHIILAGISEMTESFELQAQLVQSLVQKKFDGILEKGIEGDELFTRTKEFAKNELENKIEQISADNQSMTLKLASFKKNAEQKIQQLQQAKSENETELDKVLEQHNALKKSLREQFISKEVQKWKTPAYIGAVGILLTLVFFYFRLFHIGWEYNYIQKLIQSIDNNTSDTNKDLWKAGVNVGLPTLLLFLFAFCRKRLLSKKEKMAFIEEVSNRMPSHYR